MKRLLHIRFPYKAQPDTVAKTIHNAKEDCGENFIVVSSIDDVEKTEFEIVYDPQLRQEKTEIVSGEGSLTWRP